MTAGNRYEVGRFRLDAGRRRLETTDGAEVPLTAKAFDALICLVAHAGEVVLRPALMDALWPDTVVEENNLNQVIAALRRAVGKGAIVTVPGRGYQLVLPVRVVTEHDEAEAAVATPASIPVRARHVRRVAVLAASVILLAIVLVGWRYLSVREASDASAAIMPVRADVGTEHPDAEDHYVRAQRLLRQGLNAAAHRQALESLGRALDIDPDFALARLAQARTLYYLAHISPERLSRRLADAEDRARQLAPGVPAALAYVARWHARRGQWHEAEENLKTWLDRSTEDDSGVAALIAYGTFLVNVGRAREAEEYLNRARRREPTNALPNVHLAMAYDVAGDHERALARHDDARAQNVIGYDLIAAMTQFWRLLGRDDVEKAAKHIADFAQVDLDEVRAGAWPSNLPETPHFRMLVHGVRYLEDADSGRDAMEAAFDDPLLDDQWGVNMINIALFAAHFDDPDLTIRAFGHALEKDSGIGHWQFAWTPLMEPIRAHPRFESLVSQYGLEDYWRDLGWPNEHCQPNDSGFDCG